jgi:hypothetical protein
MMPPYERTDDLRHRARSRSAPGLIPSDLPYRTTYRCVRMGCAMTVRLLNPIERCPRCNALMAVIERPQLDLEEFVVEAAAEIVAGFTALLQASAHDRNNG